MYNQYLLLRTYIAIFCAKVSQIEELRLVNLNEEDLTRWIKCIFILQSLVLAAEKVH